MLKNTLKFIIALMITLLSLIPVSMAIDEIPSENTAEEITKKSEGDNSQNNLIQEESQQSGNSENQQPISDNLKTSDIYLTGDNITIDYPIDGNLYVMANSVTISSQVGGDAFIIAKNVIITNQTYIYGNVFNLSSSLNIDGTVYDVYSLSQDTTISGFVYRDVKIASKTVNILGTIKRNAFINTENLNFKNETSSSDSENKVEGVINGSLTYFSSNEANISNENVLGKTYFSKSDEFTSTVSIQTYLFSLGTSLTTIIGIWLLLSWIAPKFENKIQNILLKRPLPIIAFGILGLLLIPIFSVILLLVGLSSILGIILLTTYIILLMLSTAIFIISVNNAVCAKLKIDKALIKLGILVICGTLYWAIKLIPYVGGFMSFIALTIGLGLVLYSTFKKDK